MHKKNHQHKLKKAEVPRLISEVLQTGHCEDKTLLAGLHAPKNGSFFELVHLKTNAFMRSFFGTVLIEITCLTKLRCFLNYGDVLS